MSIYDFINSPDIREHWEQIGYKPSPLEMAWLIWQSNNHTLLQKHSAFWTLIDNTDDCPIPAGIHSRERESLHEFLILRQQLEINLSSDFYKEEPGAVYSYRMYLEDDGDREWHSSGPLFGTFEEAYEHAQSEKIPLSPNFVEFVKTYIGKEEKQIFLRLNREKKPVYLDENHYLSEEEHELYHGVFEGRLDALHKQLGQLVDGRIALLVSARQQKILGSVKVCDAMEGRAVGGISGLMLAPSHDQIVLAVVVGDQRLCLLTGDRPTGKIGLVEGIKELIHASQGQRGVFRNVGAIDEGDDPEKLESRSEVCRLFGGGTAKREG